MVKSYKLNVTKQTRQEDTSKRFVHRLTLAEQLVFNKNAMELPSHSWSALCRHQQKLSFLANDKRANQWCHNEHTSSTKMLRAGQMMNYGLQKFAGHLGVLFLNQQNVQYSKHHR